ncbi:MAG: hypothetical protein VCC00_15815 [Deltaproteobacteria bacterium]
MTCTSGGIAPLAEARFTLARQGAQAQLIDLSIALTTDAAAAHLLTRDRDFERIAAVLPLELTIF